MNVNYKRLFNLLDKNYHKISGEFFYKVRTENLFCYEPASTHQVMIRDKLLVVKNQGIQCKTSEAKAVQQPGKYTVRSIQVSKPNKIPQNKLRINKCDPRI